MDKKGNENCSLCWDFWCIGCCFGCCACLCSFRCDDSADTADSSVFIADDGSVEESTAEAGGGFGTKRAMLPSIDGATGLDGVIVIVLFCFVLFCVVLFRCAECFVVALSPTQVV